MLACRRLWWYPFFMINSLWAVVLGYIFLRPFVSELDYAAFSLIINTVFILASSFYIFKKDVKASIIDKAVLLFLLGLSISIAFSTNRPKSISYLNIYLPMAALGCMARAADNKEVKRLGIIILLGLIVASVYSLAAMSAISKFISYFITRNPGYPFAKELMIKKRAYLPFPSPNLFAGYLLMTAMLSLGQVAQKIKEKKTDRILTLNLCCLGVSIFLLFLTKSVGGWATFLFCAIIFSVLGRPLDKSIVLVILLVAVLSIAVFTMRMSGNEDFTKPTFSFYKRVSYWKDTADIIHKYPLTGTGLGNVFLRESRSSHNSYLQILAEMGPAGLVGWLLLALLFIKKGIENLRFSEARYYSLGILTAGISFLVHNITDYSFFVPQAAFLWWIVLGLTFNCKAHQSSS